MPATDKVCAERRIIGSLDDRVEQRLHYRERRRDDVPLQARTIGLPQERVLDAIPLFAERLSPRPRDG
jgi:hypothetical protein